MPSIRSLHISASLFAMCLTSSAFAATPAEDLVAKWLNDTSFGLPVKVGKSSFDPANQAVVLTDVTIGDGTDTLIKYKTLTLTDPRLTGEGKFAADILDGKDVKVNITLNFKKWLPKAILDKQKAENPDAAPPPIMKLSYAMDSLIYNRLEMPMTAPTFAKDGKLLDYAFDVARWSTKFRADYVQVDKISFSGGIVGSDEPIPTTTYEQFFLSGLHDGRVERAGAYGMEQKQIVDGDEITSKIDSMTAVGQDINAIIDTLDPKAYKDGKGDGVWRTALINQSYSGIEIATPGPTIKIGEISAAGFRVRQTATPLLETLETMMADPTKVDADPMPFVENLLPNIFGYYGVDRLRIADINVSATENEYGKLGSIEINKFDSDGIGSMSFNGFDMKIDNEFAGRFSQINFGNIKFGDIMSWVRLGEASDAGQPTPAMIRDAILEGNSSIDFFEAAGIAGSVGDQEVTLDGLSIAQGDYLKRFPRRLETNITNLTIPVSLLNDPPEGQAELLAMGYEKITVNAGATLTWDTEKGDVRADDVTVKLTDMGILSGDIHLGNLPLSIFDQPLDLEQRTQEGTLVDAKLTFGNKSIVERTFEAQAKKLNQKPEDFQKNFAAAIPMMLSFLDDKDIQNRFQEVLKTFFAKPESLVVTVKPAAPLSFATMAAMPDAKPQEIMDILKFTIEANK